MTKIVKYSGELVDFEIDKLIQSLRRTKADERVIQQIANEIKSKLYDGITTKQIYQLAYKMLNKSKQRPCCASRYKLKKAIMELGPSGFPFERFVAAILDQEGFNTKVGVIMQGHCVSHEVDVIAKNDTKHYMVECKFHNRQGKVNDVKIPLYIQSRFMDLDKQCKINEGSDFKFHQGWIYTNTRFTTDAIQFGECAGLKLISWDYPEKNSLTDQINRFGLFPITSLTTLTKREKQLFLDNGYVLCKDICNTPEILNELGIDRKKHKKILENARDLYETMNGAGD
ncbi:MAG: ATP cone domain-containing protein [Bacteroidota bacterium]